MHIKQAIILAGGKGTRLRPHTIKVPKPMVDINGYPFLDYLLNNIYSTGIRRVLILVGYKSQVIINHYKNFKHMDISFSYSHEDALTGTRIMNAYNLLDPHFLLMYGDNYWEIELKKMIAHFKLTKRSLMTTVYDNKMQDGEYGKENNIYVSDLGFVKKYDKSRKSRILNGVDIGFFIIDKNILKIEKSNFSFEELVLKKLALKGMLSAYVTNKKYYYITNNESLEKFRVFSKSLNNPFE